MSERPRPHPAPPRSGPFLFLVCRKRAILAASAGATDTEGTMGKGTIIGDIQCTNCCATVFELPDDDTDSVIIKCTCGTVLGPFGDLKARAKNEPQIAQSDQQSFSLPSGATPAPRSFAPHVAGTLEATAPAHTAAPNSDLVAAALAQRSRQRLPARSTMRAPRRWPP